jgi:hypothetical protein
MAQPVTFVLHDLRRTAATGMADLDVLPHVIEAVLNHSSGTKAGVAGIYNHSKYTPQVTTALAMWADHILALVEGPRFQGRATGRGVSPHGQEEEETIRLAAAQATQARHKAQ